MSESNIDQLLREGTITELRSIFLNRDLSIEEAVKWFLSRIDSLNQSGMAINAVREVSTRAIDDARNADRLLAKGRVCGPLHGIPMLLKDNILTADGMSSTAGAAALADFKSQREATIVRRLRQAGAIIIGKTNLTEFADYVSDVMPSCFSGAGGIVRNPHGMDYGRGQGSSVGSAAAVSASFAMFAIGTETQNSIQAPAAYSSIVGYKPSVGIVSRAGIFPLVPSQDSPGPMTRSVEDAALVASILVGADCRDTLSLLTVRTPISNLRQSNIACVRIGVPRSHIASRPEFEHVMHLFENCLSRLSRAGATIIDPCELPSAEQLQDIRSCVFRTEFKAALNAFLEDNGAPCSIGSLAELIAWNEDNPDSIPYGQSLLIAAEATRGLDDPAYRADRNNDIFLSRNEGIDAALTLHDADILIAPMGAAAKCTGKAGAPVVSIPVGIDCTGVPFGITLFGAVGSDASLLAIAVEIDRLIGHRLIPDI